jgi:hypothetical protein
VIKVFRVRGQSKLITGIEGAFDTREIDEYMSTHPRSAVVTAAALDDVTLFVVVNEPDKR